MISLIPDGLVVWLTGAVAAVAGVAIAYLRGRATARKQADADADEAYRKTMEQMFDAEAANDNPDAAREWLSKYGKR